MTQVHGDHFSGGDGGGARRTSLVAALHERAPRLLLYAPVGGSTPGHAAARAPLRRAVVALGVVEDSLCCVAAVLVRQSPPL